VIASETARCSIISDDGGLIATLGLDDMVIVVCVLRTTSAVKIGGLLHPLRTLLHVVPRRRTVYHPV
jgi:hypothetical protein